MLSGDLLNQIVRVVVLLGLLAYFSISLTRGLIDDPSRDGRGPLATGTGQDPGVRVLLLNRQPPDPIRTYDKLDVAILQTVDVVTPYNPDDPQLHLTLHAGSTLRIQSDTKDGLMLGSKEWGKDYTWAVSSLRVQPSRTVPEVVTSTTATAEANAQASNPARRDPTLFEAADRDAVFALPGGRYRGSLEVIWHSAKDIEAINCLPMESYIEGVISVEMSPSYPLEALKAQAIASRGYAFAHQSLARNARVEYDVMDTADDQEYRGTGNGNAAVRGAVRETRGVVTMVDHTNPFAPLFCASSGGYTESIDNVLPNSRDVFGRVPLGLVMTAHPDRFCQLGAEGLGYMGSHWTYTTVIKPSDLQLKLSKLLEAEGKHVGYIHNLRVGRRDKRSNRVETVLVDHTLSADPIEIPAHSFRMLVGPNQLRSTLWSADSPKRIESSEGKRTITYQITSIGFGHGVGMSQISAWEMANEKYLAPEILKAFYQDIQLVTKW